MTKSTSCYFCGKEIHFDPNIKSKHDKYIPLSGKTGTRKHRCPAKPSEGLLLYWLDTKVEDS